MKKKYLLLLFFTPLVLSIFIAEILVFSNKNKHRHIIDYKATEVISNSLSKNYEHILIGDSLLDNAIGNIKLKDNILDLSTSAYLTLPGNYLLLKRALSNRKNTPKNVFLFLSTSILNKISDGNKELYYKTVFNKKDEISIIKKIEMNNSYNMFTGYFLSRKRAFVKEYYKPQKRQIFTPISLNNKFTIKTNYNQKKVINSILEAKYTLNNLNHETKISIKMISELTKEKGINLYFVFQPAPKDTNKLFENSKFKEYLISNNYKIININDYYSFNNYYFKDDGVHIKGKINKYYTYLIDKYVIDIF